MRLLCCSMRKLKRVKSQRVKKERLKLGKRSHKMVKVKNQTRKASKLMER
jgi:hypothetical protein